MSTSLAAITKIKLSQLYPRSFAYLMDRRMMLFIGHRTGIQLYDIQTEKMQEVKLDKDKYQGPFSCFTVSDELIFFCCGSKVLAMAANLKIVLEFESCIAVDKINSIHVHGYRLFLVSQNMLNEFVIGGAQISNKKSRIAQSPVQKTQDASSQIFDAKINDSLLMVISAQKPFLLLLKSNNQILAFEKKDSQVAYQTNSPPTIAFRYPQNQQNQNRILIGTANGEILYLKVNRKAIIKIWEINQTKGRINNICELKNGFFVARDQIIEFWNQQKEIVKQDSVQQKIICSCFLPVSELLVYGTANGTVIQMKNYQKYIKESKKLNEVKHQEQIIKQIENLKYKKSILQQKIAQKKGSKKQNHISILKKINVKSSISIDYVNLCYNIELQSEEKISKIICQGPVNLIEENSSIYFESDLQDKSLKVYILRYQNLKSIQIKVKYQETYNQTEKLILLIYFSFEARVHSIQIDLKQLSLHQKVSIKSFNIANPYLNKLEVRGNFKFQMKMWMNGIFNDFSTEEVQGFDTACYESIVTKNKIYLKFQAGILIILSQSVIPLQIIKKKLMQKSRDKNLSLSFQTSTTPESIKQFFLNIEPQMIKLQEIRRKYELLPGLLELKNELSLQSNEQLLKILDQKQNINSEYKQKSCLQKELKEKIVDLYRSYKNLNSKDATQFEEKSILAAIQKWDKKLIFSIICS